jgi:cytochrome c553
VQSRVAPVPINGGTLTVSKDGLTAIAADPDRDRVVLVDLKGAQVLATISLQAGDEPGRLVEDAAQRLHVVLRHSGQLATISLSDHKLLSRRHVCPAPQGIAYDAKSDSLHVACTSGELVTLPAAGGPASRSVDVDFDLRDVIVKDERLFVTRFKSAELLELDENAAVISRRAPAIMEGANFGKSPSDVNNTFAAAVAWRAIATPSGIAMLHQRAQVEAVALHSSMDGSNGSSASATDGGVAMDCTKGPCAVPAPPGRLGAAGSAYGGGLPCSSIVQSSLSTMDMNDAAPVSGPMLGAVTLAVDTAVSPSGQWLAVGVAGNSSDQPSAFGSMGGTAFGQVSVVVMPLATSTSTNLAGTCLEPFSNLGGAVAAGQVTAVAFDAANRLVIQTRDPNRIRVLDDPSSCVGCTPTFAVDVDMGGEARRDTGHDLFHINAGAGLACASCHPGGGDDGRTWQFKEEGPRRTQLFNMGIRNTLPLHWDGMLPTFSALVQEVFERRMGGAVLDDEHIQVMSDWVNSMHPNAPMRAADDPVVTRGQALFESKDVGCTNCHSGPMLTNNQTVDVGTEGMFQVPSLIGVVYHQPYLHTGCAQTLRQRFDPACGGTKHGNTRDLSEDQLGDLVAYLESL